jgi:N-acetylmuramic acid 6-phosphate etherase
MTTETNSYYDNLEKMSVTELLANINKEDQTVPHAVQKAIPKLEKLVLQIVERMKKGGRLFYIGAGTSGRLGVVDASECPPTFGVGFDVVLALIAGGDSAIRKAVEFAEDDDEQAWKDLATYQPQKNDTLIGIAASGRTPYVIGGIKSAREEGLLTACIVCNLNSALAKEAEYPIEVIVGSEFVTGSTRMKAGTAQKLVLNMISTSVMIQLGRVKGNKMVDMALSNNKLVDRGIRFVMEELNNSHEEAEELIKKYGNVRDAIEVGKNLKP